VNKVMILVITSLMSSFLSAETDSHECTSDAVYRARLLLSFHVGGDDRIEIDETVTVGAPMPNPANAKQVFDVLEVWGGIYKGEYRMRFIYARMPGECLLMGQDILEFAVP
jgi:hypothetical protein